MKASTKKHIILHSRNATHQSNRKWKPKGEKKKQYSNSLRTKATEHTKTKKKTEEREKC
jgi:hypothetical protein